MKGEYIMATGYTSAKREEPLPENISQIDETSVESIEEPLEGFSQGATKHIFWTGSGGEGFQVRLRHYGVRPNSAVVGSICEVNQTTGKPFQGRAIVQLYGIVPEENFVIVQGRVYWDRQLRVRVSLYAYYTKIEE
jgi:hypothetical protein